jgi:hypothetical protein
VHSCLSRAYVTAIGGIAWLGVMGVGVGQTNQLPAEPAVVFRVAGTVVSKVDGRPLGQARVILADVTNRRKAESTFSSDDGRFEFTRVPAGKFSLQAARRGFLPASYDQHEQFSTAIVTGAGVDTENLTLRLSAAAVITGRVLDESGDPVRQGQVMLYRENHGLGVKHVQLMRVEQSNDLGSYEFGGMSSGTYYVSAEATPWYAVHPPKTATAEAPAVDPALNVAYPITYYGDTVDPEAATPIVIRDGGRVEIEIHLAPVPALHLIFQVSDGAANSSPQLRQIGPGGEASNPPLKGVTTDAVSPGVWEMSGIPAGTYKVLLSGRTGTLGQAATINLVEDGQQVNSSANEMTTLKFSLQVAGQNAVPEGITVFLRSDRGNWAWRPDSHDGEKPLEVTPGRYEILLGGSQNPYSILRISAAGCQVSGHTVDLTPGAAAISITAIRGSARVEGVVKQAGKPLAGAMVVLVPQDPANNHSLFRRDQSDLDGTFALNSISPGTYKLLAIEDGWDLDWSEPEVISVYFERGQTVRVENVEGNAISLREPLEAQTK